MALSRPAVSTRDAFSPAPGTADRSPPARSAASVCTAWPQAMGDDGRGVPRAPPLAATPPPAAPPPPSEARAAPAPPTDASAPTLLRPPAGAGEKGTVAAASAVSMTIRQGVPLALLAAAIPGAAGGGKPIAPTTSLAACVAAPAALAAAAVVAEAAAQPARGGRAPLRAPAVDVGGGTVRGMAGEAWRGGCFEGVGAWGSGAPAGRDAPAITPRCCCCCGCCGCCCGKGGGGCMAATGVCGVRTAGGRTVCAAEA